MVSLRNGWQIAGYSLSMQRDQARTWVAFVLMTLLSVQSVGKWYTLSRALEGPVQLAEPMVLWYNGLFTPFILFAALFLVLCDAPFYTRFDSWMLVRASRKSWYAGKCLEILGLCTCYIVVTTGVGLLASIPIGYGANRWSLVLQQAIQDTFQLNSGVDLGTTVTGNVLFAAYPWGTLVRQALLFIAYGTLLGMLTLVLNIAFRRLIGTGLAFLLHTAASLAETLKITQIQAVNPARWMMLRNMDAQQMWGGNTFLGALCGLLAAAAVLAIVGYWIFRRVDMEREKT
ncbi:MAG: hypothetical protein ACOYJA_10650 [Christensenellales bacterium]|jgi:hypothetical protein